MPKSIVWFRQDLRAQDNPALFHASDMAEVIPVYIYDTSSENDWPMGGASKWWLHHSLQALLGSGVPVILREGNPLEVLQDLIKETGATSVHWNRCYEPYAIVRDKVIKETLDIETFSYNGSLLYEPWEIQNKQGSFFKVFTPFWKNCLSGFEPRKVLPKKDLKYSQDLPHTLEIDKLDLLPKNPDWAKGFHEHWKPGESGAHEKLGDFLENGIDEYKKGRDFPALEKTSRLSPHLHFGEISPNQIWETVKLTRDWTESNVSHFMSEIGWREFSYYLLYHSPDLPEAPFQKKFTRLPWEKDESFLEAWQKGETGYPIVDAGMRELWATGSMHNRVRMVVASFLTKHCLIPWQDGERWFWDTLVDADLASNSASWQWVAGCGADASPYFRIFNPVTQSQKFDPEGTYLRRWVPEIAKYKDKYIHAPWKASPPLQKEAGCIVGKDYPAPIVSLEFGRARALDAYGILKD